MTTVEESNVPVDQPLEDTPAEEKQVDEESKNDEADDTPAPQHPLQHLWTLWYDSPASGQDWSSKRYKPIMKIDTVENFWGLFNNLNGPSQINAKANYHLFKEGIFPMWEDEANKNGGKWVYSMHRGTSADQLDAHWLTLILSMIGENFDDSDEILGAVISPRKGGYKLALWTRTAKDKEACIRIGRRMKELLGINEKLSYQSHADAIQSQHSFANTATYDV